MVPGGFTGCRVSGGDMEDLLVPLIVMSVLIIVIAAAGIAVCVMDHLIDD